MVSIIVLKRLAWKKTFCRHIKNFWLQIFGKIIFTKAAGSREKLLLKVALIKYQNTLQYKKREFA